MSIISSGGRILLKDDFSAGETDSDLWKINEWKPGPDNGSFYNGTQIRQSLPVSLDGHLQLQLDTFHDGNLSYPPSFFGSEAISQQVFDLTNGPLAFEARIKMSQDQSGIVMGFFTFIGPANRHDEIDFELITKRFGEIQTNVYHNEPLSEGTWKSHDLPGGGTLASFRDYRIEWYHNMVVWKVDGEVVRTVTAPQNGVGRNLVPEKPMNLHLNIWGAPSNWPVGDPSLAPTRDESQNRTFLAEVDSVLVEEVARQTGTAADDLIVGTGAGEYLFGADGHDRIRGGAGDDVIDGGGGYNQVLYAGASDQFFISIDMGQRAIRIIDQSGVEGADLVIDVQDAVFADRTVHLADLALSASLDTSVFAAVIDLYSAYLGRAPDALGLHYWAGQLARGVDPGVLADFFLNEAVDSLYSGLDGAAVVGSAYRAILGREAGAEEVAFWLGYAAELDLDPGQLPRAIVDAARSGEAEHLSLKSALSAYYALANGLGGGDGALAMYQATSLQAGRDLADSLRADAAAGGELTVSVVGLDLSAFGLPL